MATNTRSRARTRPAQGLRRRATGSDAQTFALLERLKLNLQATREKLMLVQPDTLNDADHARWSEEIFKVSVAINAVRKALLGQVSAAFAAELPAIGQAAEKLTDDLFELQRSVDVIRAVASVLGIIESVVTLVG